MLKLVPTHKYYWDVIIGDYRYECQRNTKMEAHDCAADRFADICRDDGVQNAITTAKLVRWYFDEEADEMIDVERVNIWLEYGEEGAEFYQDDYI